MTAAGNFRVNNYRTETGEDQEIRNQVHFLTRTSGLATLSANDGNVQTFTITNFPDNATSTSRTLALGTDIFLNGNDTQAEHLLTLQLPATNTAQARQTFQSSVYLGPLYGSRTVNITVGYTLRVSGDDLLVDFDLESAPSDISVSMNDVSTLLNYTATGVTSRVDNFITLQDENGDYTFSGENELLITFHPFTTANYLSVVPVVVGGSGTTPDQLNDVNTGIPGHSFDSVEIPDTIDFRTFSPDHYLRHSDLATLLLRRDTQWCYGLALLHPVAELSFTDLVDFTQGIVLISPNTSRYKLTVGDDGTLKTEIVT